MSSRRYLQPGEGEKWEIREQKIEEKFEKEFEEKFEKEFWEKFKKAEEEEEEEEGKGVLGECG